MPSNNPFYVPPVDISPVMTGIGSIIDAKREDNQRVLKEQQRIKLMQEKELKRDMIKQEIGSVMESGDPEAMSSLLSKDPRYGDVVNKIIGFKDAKTKQAHSEGLARSIGAMQSGMTKLEDGSYEFSPESIISGQNAMSEMADVVSQYGGKPTQMGYEIDSMLDDPQGTLNDMKMTLMATNPALYKQVVGSEVDNKEFFKEERAYVRQAIKKFDGKVQAMRSNYSKLIGLAEQATKGGKDGKGSRGARNAMTVAVGRLMSPGIFTETEASALSGGQNSLQAILAVLAGKGVDISALERNVDPYGDAFDVEGLLNIGRSIVTSERKPLIDMYESSRDRATRSGISGRAFNTNFGNNINYEFLQEFGQDSPVPSPVAPPVAPAQQAQPQANVPPAPQGAVDKLRANPHLAQQFKKKYGYLPEGM